MSTLRLAGANHCTRCQDCAKFRHAGRWKIGLLLTSADGRNAQRFLYSHVFCYFSKHALLLHVVGIFASHVRNAKHENRMFIHLNLKAIPLRRALSPVDAVWPLFLRQRAAAFLMQTSVDAAGADNSAAVCSAASWLNGWARLGVWRLVEAAFAPSSSSVRQRTRAMRASEVAYRSGTESSR